MKKKPGIIRRFWQRIKNWALVRGGFVSTLWVVLGLMGAAYVGWVRPEDSGELLAKLHEFADPWLPGSLFVGAVLFVGLINLLFRRWSQKLHDGFADEISDAATHFAAVSCVLFAWEKSQGSSPQLHSMLIALVGLLLGIVLCKIEPEVKVVPETEIESLIEEPADRRSENCEPVVDYGFKITFPDENALVDEQTAVKGTAGRMPPDGTEIWLVRRWAGYEWEYYPLARIHLNQTPDGRSFEWTVPPEFGYVGGNPGKGEKRHFEVWLIGPEGMRLVRHYTKWDRYLGVLRKYLPTIQKIPEFKNANFISQAISDQTNDMTRVASRLVERR
jgi:hypothetical protein